MVNTVRAKLPLNGRTRVPYSRFALVAILAPICGCAVTQPASTPASSSAPPTVTVVSGERQRIDFISVLNPDCSSAGHVTVGTLFGEPRAVHDRRGVKAVIFVDMDGVLADFDRHHETVVDYRCGKLLDNANRAVVEATGCSTPRCRRWRTCRSSGTGSDDTTPSSSEPSLKSG
jgi:hypothetical protein